MDGKTGSVRMIFGLAILFAFGSMVLTFAESAYAFTNLADGSTPLSLGTHVGIEPGGINDGVLAPWTVDTVSSVELYHP